MRWRNWIGIVCLAIAPGCDRPKTPTASAPPPVRTTAPAPMVALLPPPPDTEPAEVIVNAPPGCVIRINQRAIAFPPAMLRISKKDEKVVALLYSDDPKDALDNDYRGNGFYFQLPLDVPDTSFDEATWIHVSQSSDRVDTPDGIFLNGHRRQLQPMDVRIRLRPSASGGMKVEMAGTFLSVDPQDELAPTQLVPVAAWLLADRL